MATFSEHMPAVRQYRTQFQQLQAVWDTLTLLGQLSGTATETGETRQAFEALTADLLAQLTTESREKTGARLRARAQVAIDILVRNLFERTADIGFLAGDGDLVDTLQCWPSMADSDRQARRETLRQRLADYRQFYSVYANVQVLTPEGAVLVDLAAAAQGVPDWLPKALQSTVPFLEIYGPSALAGGRPALHYVQRITQGHHALGVLVLTFDLAAETAGIFQKLQDDPWMVLAVIDTAGTVLASSDSWQIPLGAPLPAPTVDGILRFGGVEYLAARTPANAYQGYPGPGWQALALIPLQQAFAQKPGETQVSAAVATQITQTSPLFSAALRAIPTKAAEIQGALNRLVWNGTLHSARENALNPAFSRVLLWEISRTGQRTQNVFAGAIDNLQKTIVGAALDDSAFTARLAMDIFDRNLYERANDCRWWAMDPALRAAVAAGQPANPVLVHINALYSVYQTLVLFDCHGVVLGVSNERAGLQPGETIAEAWWANTLKLAQSAQYAVSPFAPSAAYGGAPTYIYSAALRDAQDRVIGGIGLVFDSTPQFQAMLQDVLPRLPGAFAVFVQPNGHVLASTTEQFAYGDPFPWFAEGSRLAPGQTCTRIVEYQGQHYTLGIARSAGYREFKTSDGYADPVLAAVLQPLCPVPETASALPPGMPAVRSAPTEAKVDVATFRIGPHWFGLTDGVVEAIACAQLTRIAGAASGLSEMLAYQGAALPVARLPAPFANAAAAPKLVIVLKTDAGMLGLGVDELGAIPHVAEADIQAAPAAVIAQNPLVASVLRPGTDGDQLVLLLDPDKLVACLKPMP